jgi:transcriptional regulator with GAF, ATPase, and Fis domain
MVITGFAFSRRSSPSINRLRVGRALAHEREAIELGLHNSAGRISGPRGAARSLGIPASTLESRTRRLGIDKIRYRKRH